MPVKVKYTLLERRGEHSEELGRFDLTRVAKALGSLAEFGDEVELWCAVQLDRFVVKVVKETCPACGKEAALEGESWGRRVSEGGDGTCATGRFRHAHGLAAR